MILNITKHYLSTHVNQSSLFINGLKASEAYVFLTPHVDIEQRLKNINELTCQLKSRNSQYDIDKLKKTWRFYLDLNTKKKALEQRKLELSSKISQLMNENRIGSELDKYKTHLSIVKENYKHIKQSFLSVEEQAYLIALQLPNGLHPVTPTDNQEKVIFSNTDSKRTLSSEIQSCAVKKFSKNYLLNKAALAELKLLFHASKLLRDRNFVQLSNPDLVKSLIAEGSGVDPFDSDSSLVLKDPDDENPLIKLHLFGGASFQSFIAYHAKNIVPSKFFPLKYYTIGRLFDKQLNSSLQSSAATFFVATKSHDDLDKEIDYLVTFLRKLYSDLGCKFRIRVQQPQNLQQEESARISLEMLSKSDGGYCEVAYISVSDDYVSKRLMFTYQDENQVKFPKIIYGCSVNVMKLLKCVDSEHLLQLLK